MNDFDAARAERSQKVEFGPITYRANTTNGYNVIIRQGSYYSCGCGDFEYNQGGREPCKHILSLAMRIGHEIIQWDEICEKMQEGFK